MMGIICQETVGSFYETNPPEGEKDPSFRGLSGQSHGFWGLFLVDSALSAECTSPSKMAEGEGFEPSVQALIPYSGLANRRFRPLSHPSGCNAKNIPDTSKCGNPFVGDDNSGISTWEPSGGIHLFSRRRFGEVAGSCDSPVGVNHETTHGLSSDTKQSHRQTTVHSSQEFSHENVARHYANPGCRFCLSDRAGDFGDLHRAA